MDSLRLVKSRSHFGSRVPGRPNRRASAMSAPRQERDLRSSSPRSTSPVAAGQASEAENRVLPGPAISRDDEQPYIMGRPPKVNDIMTNEDNVMVKCCLRKPGGGLEWRNAKTGAFAKAPILRFTAPETPKRFDEARPFGERRRRTSRSSSAPRRPENDARSDVSSIQPAPSSAGRSLGTSFEYVPTETSLGTFDFTQDTSPAPGPSPEPGQIQSPEANAGDIRDSEDGELAALFGAYADYPVIQKLIESLDNLEVDYEAIRVACEKKLKLLAASKTQVPGRQTVQGRQGEAMSENSLQFQLIFNALQFHLSFNALQFH